MNCPIIMHINFCEQGQTLAEACKKAVDWGYDGVELRRKRANPNEGPSEYLDVCAKAVEQAGARRVVFGAPGPDLMHPDPAVRDRELQEALKFYELAATRFKVTVFNTMTGELRNPDKSVHRRDYERHGSVIATQEQWDSAISAFKQLGALAERLRFRLAFEIHPCYLHDLPAATMTLIQKIGSPAVGANLDYGNVIHFKEHPTLSDTLSLLGDRLFYVHLKNYARAHFSGDLVATSLADGLINHREYLRLLSQQRYAGPICIEAPRAGDREWFARQDIAYLKALLAEMART